ncbi:MAG: hypothetical protein Q8Q09_23090 [Deltaproteobacteria bacterium]|nr:hypothetical protein [Deltaproteobacteria bacterium]
MAAVVEATERSTAQLLLVTADAGNHTLAAAERWEAAGILLRKFSTRESLGTSLNRGEVAIVAVLDPGIAAELTTTFDRFAALEDG